MPEGDTIHHAARRVGAALAGRPIESIETPQPRHRHDRWPERLGGRAVRAVDAHGKHLFLRFDGDLTLHSHLRMGGKWEGCHLARVDPWRPVARVTDDEALAIVRAARPLMRSRPSGAAGSRPSSRSGR